jgi:hypothetical protein
MHHFKSPSAQITEIGLEFEIQKSGNSIPVCEPNLLQDAAEAQSS